MSEPALRLNEPGFSELGYEGPFRVLNKAQCDLFLRAISDRPVTQRPDWDKAWAVSSRAFYEMALHPEVISRVQEVLGHDVMLWGVSLVRKASGAIHGWHSDVESASSPGRSVSVWLGLKNTSIDSSLRFISYSHRFNITVQQLMHAAGKARDEVTEQDVLDWSRERDERAYIERVDMADGEAVLFDGAVWHGSHNRSEETRTALLLQYATPAVEIRIPMTYDWPFQPSSDPLPPCLIVRGDDEAGVNRIVHAPVAAKTGWDLEAETGIYPLKLPLATNEVSGWKPHHILKGSTAALGRLSCHASSLLPGCTPHPPHQHLEEEILLVLSGEVEVNLPHLADSEEGAIRILRTREFVYYPAGFLHTLTAVGSDPANYVMFKWVGPRLLPGVPMPFGRFVIFGDESNEIKGGFRPRVVFDSPTTQLRRLQCHTSTLGPGTGYEAHIDSHDVAIVVLDGEVETLGERAGPCDVIFYRAGDPHGMSNPGQTVAKYIVFEFHAGSTLREALPDDLPVVAGAST